MHTLTAMNPTPNEQRVSGRAADNGSAPPRLLVVEDEAIVAMDLVQRLSSLGLQICAIADNSDDALAMALQHKPDLVLMDVVIKGPTDGIETARQLLQSLQVPVIFLTSFNDTATIQRAALAAPYGYVTKPFQIRELHAAIDVALYKASLDRRLRESERWLDSTLRSVTDGVLALDEQGRVRFMNAAAERALGQCEAQVIGQSVDDVLAPLDLLGRDELAGPAPDTGAPVLQRRRLLKPDGQWRVFDHSATAIRDAHGSQLGSLHALRDVSAQVQAEESLRRSEIRFRALSEAAPLGVFATDAAGACTYTNARWQSIYGLSLAESLGHGWNRTLHPDDKEAVFTAWQRSAASLQDFDMEFRVRRDDGSTRYVRCIARPVRGDNGLPSGHVGSVEDVTERMRMQRALSNERTRLAAIIDATGAGTWEWNVQTGEVKINPRWAEIIGWKLEELGAVTARFRAAIGHPDEQGRTHELLREHFAERSDAYLADVRLRHRDGRWVWVQDRGRVITRTPAGKPEWMFGTHIDITLRKQQEEELRRQQDLLDRTGNLARVGGWELDVATGALRWSDEIRRMYGVPLGYQPDLAASLDFYPPEVRAKKAAAIELAMQQGEPWDLQLPMLRADGTRVWVHSVGKVQFHDGKPMRVFGAVQDISERHALDQVLAHKTKELQRSNEDLERFAYVTSHDLQEPLRMVTSYGQLLTRRHLADLKPEAQEFVSYMVDGGQRAQALIRDLLSMARLDSHAQPWTAVALDATLADVLHALRLRVQETAAQVTHDALPTVVGDASQLRQLMANLVGNALKFCGKTAPVVHVGAVRESGGWRISVSDNGIGIEPRYFGRIFQMFQRLHLRTDYDGTGIGLAICKKVVERHGGHIGVSSVPGQGTSFFFTMPDHKGGQLNNSAAIQSLPDVGCLQA